MGREPNNQYGDREYDGHNPPYHWYSDKPGGNTPPDQGILCQSSGRSTTGSARSLAKPAPKTNTMREVNGVLSQLPSCYSQKNPAANDGGNIRGDIQIVVFRNDKKTENQPDYDILLSESKGKEEDR